MSVYTRPVVFLVLAVAVISVGTLITTFIPLLTGTTYEKIDGIKPYNALQLTGRDIYIREGCNNCHTQTVRPLKFETDRYGEYSRGGEFAYDRPFLWGSKRTGPDLAREGGKYPDSWHYQHFNNPRTLVPESNMPAYAFLAGNKIDPAYAEKKMKILGFPYTPEEILALSGKTEMDALVAYMQKLGADFKALTAKAVTAKPAEAAVTNPYSGNEAAAKEGEEIFEANCEACHGKDLTGGIGPNLVDNTWIFGSTDTDIYETVSHGRPGGMPSFEKTLGEDRIWKVITYIKSKGAQGHESSEGH
jgi:cytochrome c oxidase cbb3-type subunit II